MDDPIRPDIFTLVQLRWDIPELGLQRGDRGYVLDYQTRPDGGEDEAIFQAVDPSGHSKGVFAIPASAIEEV